MCISLRPSTYVMGSSVNLGSLGSKGRFHYKCYNSSMLHSLTIRLIGVHQLETLYLFYGVKCQSGVIWGNWGQKVIMGKNALTCPCYIAWPYDSYMSISLRPSTFVTGSNVNLESTWGHSGRVRRLWRQQIILPAQPQDLVSYSFPLSFFLLSSFFLSGNTSFSHTSLHPIFTKLGQSDRYLNQYSGTDNGGLRGHDGVTGVKKVIFTKKASSPTEYLALMRDLCICISLTPSTKVMVLKIHPGSFGVTGVKRSFSPKGIQFFRIRSIDALLMHMH